MKGEKLVKNLGFTLIELMITVTIIGILGSIAVHQYFEFVKESRRGDATSTLQNMLAQQALYRGNFGGTYTGDVIDLGYIATGNNSTTTSNDGHYTITLSACAGETISECVSITAVPRSDSQLKDSQCELFSLNSRGAETSLYYVSATPVANNEICWKQ
jgi:type IV pilus assembly protein PilE